MPSRAVLIGKVGAGQQLRKLAMASGFTEAETIVVETNLVSGDDVPEDVQEKVNEALKALDHLDEQAAGDKFLFYYSR